MQKIAAKETSRDLVVFKMNTRREDSLLAFPQVFVGLIRLIATDRTLSSLSIPRLTTRATHSIAIPTSLNLYCNMAMQKAHLLPLIVVSITSHWLSTPSSTRSISSINIRTARSSRRSIWWRVTTSLEDRWGLSTKVSLHFSSRWNQKGIWRTL